MKDGARMAISLTQNWGNVQIKSIDPFSDVHSDITSRLTKIMGSDNCYINGLDLLKYQVDLDTKSIIVTLTPGIAIVSNIVIEFTETTVSKLATFPIPNMDTYYLVIEYVYAKTNPPPIATIKGVKSTVLDTKIHLPLYAFKLNGWNTVINDTVLKAWIENGADYLKDERHKTGYLSRSGGTIHGRLKTSGIVPKDPNEVVTKQFVERFVRDTVQQNIQGIGGSSNFLLKSGGQITGPIVVKNDPLPVFDNELVTKSFVVNHSIRRSGDTMSGPLILWDNPTQPKHAATKQYVDRTMQNAISHMNISLNHSTMANLANDDHPHYMLANGGRSFTGAVEGVTPTRPMHLATKKYIDEHVDTINNRIDALAHTSGGGVRIHSQLEQLTNDDHPQYIKTNGTRAFTGKVSGVYPTDNDNLTTKKYVDDRIAAAITSGGSHSTLTNLTADDHPQYARIDGARAFTNPILVPDATNEKHAVNLKILQKNLDYHVKVTTSINFDHSLPVGSLYYKYNGTGDTIEEVWIKIKALSGTTFNPASYHQIF